MGDPVTMMVIGTAISTGSQMMAQKSAAEGAAQEAEFARRQAESAALDERLASTQEEVIRRRELNDTLSTLDAIRSSRGLSLNSPTGMVQRKTIGNAYADDIRTGKLNRLTRQTAYQTKASFAARQGKSALKAGPIGMLSALGSGVATGYSQMGSPSIFGYQPGKSPTQKLSNGNMIRWN